MTKKLLSNAGNQYFYWQLLTISLFLKSHIIKKFATPCFLGVNIAKWCICAYIFDKEVLYCSLRLVFFKSHLTWIYNNLMKNFAVFFLGWLIYSGTISDYRKVNWNYCSGVISDKNQDMTAYPRKTIKVLTALYKCFRLLWLSGSQS